MAGDPGSNSRVKFGPYEADIGEGVLRKSGTRVKLQQQPFQILTAMLARPNELITREYLREIVWSTDTFVDFEHGLNAAINKLRQALADSSTNPRYIQTVAGRGYRFIAPIEQAEMPAAVPLEGDAQPPAQAWAGGRMFARYWAGSILCGGILLGFVFGWLLHRPFKRPPQPQPLQFTIPIPDNLVFEPGFAHQEFAISPDGARLAFLAESQIWIHELSSAKTFPLTAARNVTNFGWSRDSQFFYFSELSDVRKVSISGGSSVGIFEMPAKTTWNALLEVDNKVALFTRSGDVFAVPETGGKPAPALARDLQYIWPQLLPDGKLLHISFDKAIQSYQAWVSNPAQLQDRRQILRTDSRVQYSPPSSGRSQGYLLYIRGGTLVAHPFDAKNLRLYGEAKTIAEDVFWFQPTGAAAFSLSDNGLVIYRKWQNKSQLKWVDRRGHELEIIGKPNSFLTPLRLSPDQTRLAAPIYDSRKGGTDIWVYDLARHLESRWTHLVGQAASPIWAPDNQRFAFLLAKGAQPKMYFKSLEESGKEQEFSGASDAFQLPTDWSRDGRFLLYQTSGSALPGARIVLLDLAHQGKRIPLLESSSQELGGVFSPNTSWVAFLSNETGQTEAYIQSFEAEPQPHLSGERQRISNDGASLIRWRADGKELYYLNGSNCVTAVSVNRLNGKLVIGSPQKLFHLESVSSEGAVAPGFDVSVDGQRFVIADPQPPRDAPFEVIQNWQKLIEP